MRAALSTTLQAVVLFVIAGSVVGVLLELPGVNLSRDEWKVSAIGCVQSTLHVHCNVHR